MQHNPADAATDDAVDTTDAATDESATAADLLAGLDALPLHEHAARYEQIHAELQNALREIDGG